MVDPNQRLAQPGYKSSKFSDEVVHVSNRVLAVPNQRLAQPRSCELSGSSRSCVEHVSSRVLADPNQGLAQHSNQCTRKQVDNTRQQVVSDVVLVVSSRVVADPNQRLARLKSIKAATFS